MLQKLQLGQSSVVAYCLLRQGASTLVASLHDVGDPNCPLALRTVDNFAEEPLHFPALMSGDSHGFWAGVLERDPVVEQDFRVPAQRMATGAPYRTSGAAWPRLVARAELFQWRPQLHSHIRTVDLQAHSGTLGIHWDILRETSASEAATQTAPTFWPLQASPLFSVSAPVRRPAEDCEVAAGSHPAGTLFHLDCPSMALHCTIPCLQGYHIWAVRVGDRVLGACTRDLSWQNIVEVAELSTWDLPGLLLHSGEMAWEWPQDLHSFSGQCGYLFNHGSEMIPCGRCAAPHEHSSEWTGSLRSDRAVIIDRQEASLAHSWGIPVWLGSGLTVGRHGFFASLPLFAALPTTLLPPGTLGFLTPRRPAMLRGAMNWLASPRISVPRSRPLLHTSRRTRRLTPFACCYGARLRGLLPSKCIKMTPTVS